LNDDVPSLRISAQIAPTGFRNTLFKIFRRPRCATPITMLSTPCVAAASTTACNPGISVSAPSTPNRFADGNDRARSRSSASAEMSRRSTSLRSRALTQCPFPSVSPSSVACSHAFFLALAM
jgi:hypothetical protein